MDLSRGVPRVLVWGAAGTIGVLWIAIALYTLWHAAQGFRNGRMDFGLGWGIVGTLLLAAGIATLVGTWWHQNRVLRRHD